MATHTGLNGVVKLGSNTVGEVTGFTLNQTHDTVEDTALGDSMKSYKTIFCNRKKRRRKDTTNIFQTFIK